MRTQRYLVSRQIAWLPILFSFFLLLVVGLNPKMALADSFQIALNSSNCPFCVGTLTITHTPLNFQFLGLQDVTTSNETPFPNLAGPISYNTAIATPTNIFNLTSVSASGVNGSLTLRVARNINENRVDVVVEEARELPGFPARSQSIGGITTPHEPNHPPIPEPSTMLLFGSGLAGLGFWRYCKAKV